MIKQDLRWSMADIQTVKELAAKGFTAAEIAAVVGRHSRNAVIGLCRRQGIQLAGGRCRRQLHKKVAQPVPRRDQAAQPKKPDPEAKAAIVAKPKPEPAPAPVVPPAAPIHEPRKVHFLDIREGMCRFPLWDDDAPFEQKFFCGAPVAGHGAAYCAFCSSVMFRAGKEEAEAAAA